MTLPVLDQENYQWVCDEWVSYAGALLRQHGYLQSDPTGSYDEEFAAAVRSFQEANGITYEENQIGPYTWAALGAEDPEQSQQSDAQNASYDSSQDYEYPTSDQSAQPAATTAADPGLEVLAGGKRYIIYPDEVRSDGTISWRARNPGNIRSGERYGAYPGKKANTKSAGSFAVFPDEQTGFEAIKQVLHGYGHITVAKAMGKYAPAGDGANDPDAYARTVAKKMGVSIDTYVDTLDDSQMEIFAEAIKKVEGWTEGTTHALDDPALPAEVQRGIRGN